MMVIIAMFSDVVYFVGKFFKDLFAGQLGN